MSNSTSENARHGVSASRSGSEARRELARRNVRMALVHVALAVAFVALFFYVQTQR